MPRCHRVNGTSCRTIDAAACTHAMKAWLTRSISSARRVLGAAHERLGRDPEREVLERPVGLEPVAVLPARQPGGDGGVHRCDVPLEPVAGERLLHDPPVQVVLLEVEEHQPAAEERADQEGPGRPVREGLVGVAQRLLARVGPEQHHPGVPADHAHRRDRPVRLPLLVEERDRVAGVLQAAADDRQPLGWRRQLPDLGPTPGSTLVMPAQ